MKRLRSEENYGRKKAFKWVRLAAFIFVALFFLEVWAVNRLSTYGDKIQQLKQAQSNLELENLTLENQIATNASLVLIDIKATAFGFTSSKKLEYIKPANIASAL